MPSALHEGPLELFRNRPELAPELLRDVLGVELPDYQEARIESENLTQFTPVERRADLVVLLVDDKPVLSIALEVQLDRDEAKQYSWMDYAAILFRRFKCPTCVMVIAFDESVANWARRPIRFWPEVEIRPYVIGPGAVPLVDAEQAALDPELAVLSAMAHGRDEPDVAVAAARVALEAVRGLDSGQVTLYSDLIVHVMSDAARVAFEALMNSGTYEYQSEFVRKYVNQGRAEGEARGEARGRAEGEVQSLLMVVGARSIVLTSKQKQRIETCTNLELLGQWIRKAAVVENADELFAD